MADERGHLRIVRDPPMLAVARAGAGSGGSRGGDSIVGWVIKEHVPAIIGGVSRRLELAGWRDETWARFSVRPDWICETADRDLAGQLAFFQRGGIAHVWLVHRAARAIGAYRLEPTGFVRIGRAIDGLLRAEPFGAFELDVSSLWGSDR